jgi:hypothetical protein
LTGGIDRQRYKVYHSIPGGFFRMLDYQKRHWALCRFQPQAKLFG